MDLVVRPALPDDAPALAEVEALSWRAAYRGLMPDAFLAALSPAEKTDAWRRNLLKHGPAGRKRVLAAYAGKEMIGFVRAGVEDEAAALGSIYLLYVLPERWGGGAGAALMAAAMAELRDLGMREAMLWVLRDNRRARAFYERRGWRPDGQTTSDDYGGATLEALRYRQLV